MKLSKNGSTPQSNPVLRGLRVGLYFWILSAVWTVLLGASLWWNLTQVQITALEAARVQARTAFEKDVLYRRWNARHGGVYAPVTPKTRPNPYLKVPERDIKTPRGLSLTKVNPAYMTRQVHELGALDTGVVGHITSLRPIRPQNAPDAWETRALSVLNKGGREVSGIQKIGGKDYLRLMRPLRTERACLKCHQAQGYKVGDIRGGISVSVPLAPIMARARRDKVGLTVSHGLLWLLGMIFLGLGAHYLFLRVTERQRAEAALRSSEKRYRHLVEESFDGIFIQKGTKIVFANQQLSEMLGYGEGELEGFDHWLVYHPEYHELTRSRALARLRGELPPSRYEVKLQRKDGTSFDGEVSARASMVDGEPGIQVWVRDISQRKRTEEELRVSREQFKAFVEGSPLAMTAADEKGNLEILNEKFTEMLGYEPGEVPTLDHWWPLAYPDDNYRQTVKDAVRKGIAESKATTRSAPREWKVTCKDGAVIDIQFHSTSIGDKTLFIFVDVTDRKRAEEQVKRQRAVLGAINQVFQETLTSDTEEEVARTCLAVAEELTDSRFGFIGEINGKGNFDNIAISDPGWLACRMPGTDAVVMTTNMEITGIWGRVLQDGKSCIANDPATEPDRTGVPDGHPEWTSFLGVPLQQGGRTVGMIAVANKEAGYDAADREALEDLSVAFMEALARQRGELERERLLAELKEALAKVKTLRGLIPICASCKKIRDDQGYWQQVEVYVRERSEAQFSHGICPDCMTELYPEFAKDTKGD